MNTGIQQTFTQGLQVSVFGLGGVFLVLILFFILIKALMWLAKKYQ
ncbi:MAG TPA: OadG family protein [Firmicutes bacterium]|jgi:Na+-transporting methylmalonyl-CoA/oxaloacetate decarboxylase gamma subunit|nr:OadG family protein [Bacillota bacterium]HOQ23244.1 OadG family protein [Bacillota bacterium]HPT66672.1 OadG family protein [Bacillota bacterium]